jgi:CBS domain-containing protein
MFQRTRLLSQWTAGLNDSASLAESEPSRRRLVWSAEEPASPDDPAIQVFTDFAWESPLIIDPSRSIDEALGAMIRAGVRALIVVHGNAVVGMITSYDIQGERPLQFLRASNYLRHDEIEVGHVMTPWARVVTIDWQVLSAMRLSELAMFLRATGATHVAAVEQPDHEYVMVRGLISRTRLERRLGHPI